MPRDSRLADVLIRPLHALCADRLNAERPLPEGEGWGEGEGGVVNRVPVDLALPSVIQQQWGRGGERNAHQLHNLDHPLRAPSPNSMALPLRGRYETGRPEAAE